MKILVTGGAGFIGSRLVDELIRRGHKAVILDNLCAGKNVHKEATFILGDIRNKDDVKRAIEGCDVVYHLAALIDLRTTSKEEDHGTNYLGAKTVFDAAYAINAKIIFTSSAAVYGDAEVPVTEETKLTPLSSYAENKLRTEQLLDTSAFITRFFNVYGTGAKSFVTKACKKVWSDYE